jgi:hypothetical protein
MIRQKISGRSLHGEILVKVYFSLVLLLALSAVVDLHVELQRANVEVESHEETLLDVMIIYKLRPATLEVLFTSAVIPDLYLIGSSSPRMFTENRFSQLPPIHELGKF